MQQINGQLDMFDIIDGKEKFESIIPDIKTGIYTDDMSQRELIMISISVPTYLNISDKLEYLSKYFNKDVVQKIKRECYNETNY